VQTRSESVESAWTRRTALRQPDEESRATFSQGVHPIVERHRGQSLEDVQALRKKYAKPVFGKVRVWELIERLGSCVDPTDERLFCASQQMHVLQILDAMERDGTDTPEMVLVALIHDLGKVLLLTGEDPANVVCMNGPIGDQPAGAGLDSSVIQWNHDEFAYQRLRDHIPDHLAWLVRYHSVDPAAVSSLFDEQDLARARDLLVPFAHYDHATKSPFMLPSSPINRYRDVIEEAFPRRIRF
jgi:predicted HD phosphohydrolase